jgi:hypothetical protein
MYGQQKLGAPFKPGFGLSGIPQHSTRQYTLFVGDVGLNPLGLRAHTLDYVAGCLRNGLPAPAMLRSIMNLGINVLEPTHAGAYLVANNRPPEKLRFRTKAM